MGVPKKAGALKVDPNHRIGLGSVIQEPPKKIPPVVRNSHVRQQGRQKHHPCTVYHIPYTLCHILPYWALCIRLTGSGSRGARNIITLSGAPFPMATKVAPAMPGRRLSREDQYLALSVIEDVDIDMNIQVDTDTDMYMYAYMYIDADIDICLAVSVDRRPIFVGVFRTRALFFSDLWRLEPKESFRVHAPGFTTIQGDCSLTLRL